MAPRIRPATADDADAVTALRSATTPYLIATPEFFRWRLTHQPAAEKGRWLVAETDGAVVGFARATLEWETSLPGQGMLTVAVFPRHRGRGAGTALAEAGLGHLASVGATTIRTFSIDDAGRRFADRAGFRPVSTAHHQVLDLDALPETPPAPAGVELRPYTDFADDPRPVHAVESAALADEPSDFPLDSTPYDTWLEHTWALPVSDHELSTVAVVDGAPAAVVNTISSPDGRIGSGFTGCLREYRSRGVVKYAKTATLHRARDRGFTRAFTENDSTNAPMLAINTWLGYRFHATETVLRLDL